MCSPVFKTGQNQSRFKLKKAGKDLITLKNRGGGVIFPITWKFIIVRAGFTLRFEKFVPHDAPNIATGMVNLTIVPGILYLSGYGSFLGYLSFVQKIVNANVD